tara:strand:+ start:2205 stop:2798 length:594 start_codon:yes stop_codon:yes gene_type:complete
MANLIIKPNSAVGDKLIIQDRAGAAVLTTADSGATFSGGNIGTVTQGNLQGTAWRRVNCVTAYVSNSSHNSGTNPQWVYDAGEGPASAVGFHLNSDNCITHTDNTTSFVCASAGVYLVYASLIPYSSSGAQRCFIRVNGNNMTDSRNAGSADVSNHSSASASIILQLAVNDSVDVAAGGVMHQGFYSNFFMVKLGEA